MFEVFIPLIVITIVWISWYKLRLFDYARRFALVQSSCAQFGSSSSVKDGSQVYLKLASSPCCWLVCLPFCDTMFFLVTICRCGGLFTHRGHAILSYCPRYAPVSIQSMLLLEQWHKNILLSTLFNPLFVACSQRQQDIARKQETDGEPLITVALFMKTQRAVDVRDR
jgi:hypothetical protein